ncbi:hypothetical protein T484DRAFT_1809431 [Baffinella frigidus]|nr:hypothetical protein T484DRAFT_1809431 [Cryptophyta sp. CCMP2293]
MAGSGEEVAVKIRHPAVLHETFVDIHLIFAFMKTLGPLTCGNFTIPFSRHDFHAVLQRQTDFTLEAENLARFRRYFDGDALVVFPSVSHVSDAVLVESWAPGVLISEGFKELGEFFQKIPAEKRVKRHMSESLEKRQANSRLAEVVFSAVMKMFLRDNFIHGDLHGGNVIRSSLPSNAKVTIIDAGVVTSIAPAFQPRFHAFLQDLCQGRPGAITDSLLEFHIGPPRDRGALLRDIEETCARWVHQGSALERGSLLPTAPGGGPVMLGDLIGEILFKVQRQKLHLRGDVASTIVSMSLVEGMVKQLDPDFDVVGSALPYFKMYAPHSGLAKL